MRDSSARPPINTPCFYGWVILAVSMVGCFMAASSNQLFMGVMLKPISEDMGWSRTVTSGAFTAGTIVSGVGSAFVGPLVDKFGQRVVLPVGAVLAGVALYAIGGMQTLAQFYLAYIVTRTVAQGALAGVAPTTAMVNWFQRWRGRTIGLVNMSMPLGGATLAFLSPYLLAFFGGWRPIFFLTGTVTMLVALPAAFLVRHRPEDVGLLPDGELAIAGPGGGRRGPVDGFQFTLRQALRTPALWLLIASQGLATVASSTFGFHQSSFFTDEGLSLAVATLAVSMFGLAGALSSTIWGFLSERMNERWLAIAALVVASGAMLLLLGPRTDALALLSSFLMGFTGRGQGSLFNILLARYYGRGSYGTISGFVTPFQMTALGLGPLVGSAIHDWLGSYQTAFTLYIGFYWLAIVLIFLARAPRRPAASGVAAPSFG